MPRNHKPNDLAQAWNNRYNGHHPVKTPSNGKCPDSLSGGHHWIIGPPDGESSPGFCRLCGQVGSFWNTVDACLSTSRKKKESR